MNNLSLHRLFHSLLTKRGSLFNVSAGRVRSLSTVQSEDESSDTPIRIENPYKEPQKGCVLCAVPVHYKNVQLLSQFVSPHTGRIYGRHITGLCDRKQKQVTKAIKRARAMGFMSVTLKDPQFVRDPNVCNIRHME